MVSITSSSDIVGGNLLRKIQTTSHETENTRSVRTRSQARSPAVEPERNLPLSSRNQLLGGECQAFQTENSILKQQLLAVQEQLQQLERRMGQQVEGPVRALQLLGSVQEGNRVADAPRPQLTEV